MKKKGVTNKELKEEESRHLLMMKSNGLCGFFFDNSLLDNYSVFIQIKKKSKKNIKLKGK
jgi:hypothetical protein